MNKFNIFRTELVKIKITDCYTVEANTQEEAENIFIEAVKNNEEQHLFELEWTQPEYETIEELDPDEECSTIFIYNEDDELIWENKL